MSAPELTLDDVRAALDGTAPLAVLPEGPPAVVEAARRVLRPEEPLEPGADVVVVTSGSTGSGRAVLLSAPALEASAAATLARLGGPGSWLLALPVSAIAGLQVLVRSVVSGGTPVPLRRGESLSGAVRRLPDGRRYTALVPTQLRRDLDEEPDALRAFDAVLVGGAATDAALRARAREAGVAVVTTFGMTETAGGCVYDGRPLDGVRVRVTDGVELAGPTLALGYRLDPAATDAAFADGWFRTRDAGHLDDGGFLYVHGRLDDVIVRGGENLSPGEIENVLVEHPSVDAAAVVGIPDTEWGERVVAAVVPVDGAVIDEDELREFVRAALRSTKTPERIDVRVELPFNETGKLLRRVLRDELAAQFG